jgi:hypothetical protein
MLAKQPIDHIALLLAARGAHNAPAPVIRYGDARTESGRALPPPSSVTRFDTSAAAVAAAVETFAQIEMVILLGSASAMLEKY